MPSSRSKMALGVFVSFLVLYQVRGDVGEKFDPEVMYLFLYAFTHLW
jgi:hypothetical protein